MRSFEMKFESRALLERQLDAAPLRAESVASGFARAIEAPLQVLPRAAPRPWRRKRFGRIDLRRPFQRGCDVLADAIDVTLTALHLLGALVLAASLVATVAGLTFPLSDFLPLDVSGP
jgi:hypothetical protein